VYIHTLIETLFFRPQKHNLYKCHSRTLSFCVFVKQLIVNYDPFAHPGVGLYMPAYAKRNECGPVSMI